MTMLPGTLDGPNLPLPIGRSRFDLPLGRLLLRIEDLPTPWDPFVAQHYLPFAQPCGQDKPHLTIRCREDLGSDEIPLPPPGEMPIFDFGRGAGDLRTVRSHWSRGSIDATRGEAEITFTSRHYLPLRVSLENFLRIASQLVQTRHEAFLLHAAGIVEGGRCFLFFGPHEAGKSTIASQSQPRAALSDDLVIVDGAEPSVVSFPVPFWGVFAPASRARGEFAVAAAFRLREGEQVKLTPLPAALAIATLHANMPFVNDLQLDPGEMTALLHRFVKRVPVFDLHGVDSPGMWQHLSTL
ncbi:MAG: hypothetical protein U0V87_15050 [Acidobacteriota bacterium]